MASIFLIGFMGAGKSTVGERLASDLGWTFRDLDKVIEERAGKTIPQIFETSGETAFRELELQTLRALLDEQKEQTVYALGGGAIESDALWRLLGGHTTVYLEGEFDFLVRRCAKDGDTRPVIRDLAQAKARYERRLPLYGRASFKVRVHDGGNSRSPRDLAKEIRALLAQAGARPSRQAP